jgi:hypothetical protein
MDVVENQKGRVFGPALVIENNVKIFLVTQGSAADITLDTHTETRTSPCQRPTPYPFPVNPKVTNTGDKHGPGLRSGPARAKPGCVLRWAGTILDRPSGFGNDSRRW